MVSALQSPSQSYSLTRSERMESIIPPSLSECEIKLTGLFKRVVESPFFWATIHVAAEITFTVCLFTHLTLATLNFPLFALTVVITRITSGYLYNRRKELLFEGSLTWNLLTKNHPCNEIIPHLYLGPIPLKSHGSIEYVKELKMDAVLTVLEPHEINPGMLFEPVTSQDWKVLGIEQKIIHAPDFNPPTPEQIEEGVEFITKRISQNKNVLSHCKAGRGRSAIMTICYLLRTQKFIDITLAIAYVKEKRPEISINPKQRKGIEAYFIDYCK